MKPLFPLFRTVISLSVFFAMESCTKDNGPKYDSAPDFSYSYSLTFNPNYPSTLTTDYTVGPESVNGIGFMDQSDLSGNYRYTISAFLDRKYFNTTLNLNTYKAFNMGFSFVPDKTLTTGVYSYTMSSASDYRIGGAVSFTDANSNSVGWAVAPTSVAFSAYPDCKVTITISNMYTRHLNDGQPEHTYVDGSIDATLLGASTVDMTGAVLSGYAANYPTQLHLTFSFKGVRIEY